MGHVVRNGQRFEWDDAKQQKVLRDHRVDLAQLPRFFDGPIIEDFDSAHSQSEDRWRAIGMLDDRCVVVVYTERAGATRLVTARPAEPHEEAEFEIVLIGEALPDKPT